MRPKHDAFIETMGRTFSDRFWDKVERKALSECWNWRGYLAPNGYGQFTAHSDQKKKKRLTLWAHRCAYVLTRGQVGESLYLDHLCRNRQCVNPAHLEPVSARENLLRGATKAAENAAKEFCKHGHALSGENLYEWGGHRACRVCRKQSSMRYERTRPPRPDKHKRRAA